MKEMGLDLPLPAILRCDAKTAEVFASGTHWYSTTQRSRLKNIDHRKNGCRFVATLELSPSNTFPEFLM